MLVLEGLLEKKAWSKQAKTTLIVARGVLTLPISYRFEVIEGENQLEKLLTMLETHNIRIDTVTLFNEVLKKDILVTVEDHNLDWDLIDTE